MGDGREAGWGGGSWEQVGQSSLGQGGQQGDCQGQYEAREATGSGLAVGIGAPPTRQHTVQNLPSSSPLHSPPPPSPPPLPCGPQMRSTRGALSDTHGGSGGGVALGEAGEPFSFESHARAHGVRVSTASVSAVDKGGVGEVAAFVRKCVPA